MAMKLKCKYRIFGLEVASFMMNEIDIIEGSIKDLSQIYNRLERDFPASERKDKNQIKLLMSKNKYKMLIAKDRNSQGIIGYAFVYETENPHLIWLDYIAIDPMFNGKGYGTLLFNKITERSKDVIGIMFEVEKADSVDEKIRKEQERRIAFYQRLGAQKLNIDYHLPTKEGSIPLDLYFKPADGINYLSKEVIQKKVSSAFDYIHADFEHRNTVLKGFINHIDDEHFNNIT